MFCIFLGVLLLVKQVSMEVDLGSCDISSTHGNYIFFPFLIGKWYAQLVFSDWPAERVLGQRYEFMEPVYSPHGWRNLSSVKLVRTQVKKNRGCVSIVRHCDMIPGNKCVFRNTNTTIFFLEMCANSYEAVLSILHVIYIPSTDIWRKRLLTFSSRQIATATAIPSAAIDRSCGEPAPYHYTYSYRDASTECLD